MGLGEERPFKYQVYPVEYETPSYALRSASAETKYFRMEVFSLEGSHGYDVMGYTKDQLITDVLDHYERHLEFLHLNREVPGNTAITEDPVAKDNWDADFVGGEEKR